MNKEKQVEGVPFLSLQQEFQALRERWHQSVDAIGERGSFILGPNVRAFEEEAAAYVGARYAVTVANGTEALVLSLRALGIGPGDEVITTPFTFFASAEAISVVGAIPVFADVDPESFDMDPKSARARITARTRAILPVHIFGHPADMTAFQELARERDLRMIEDAAQAFGAEQGGRRVGSMGDCGCFSFYPTKVLGCYGDGGMVTTNSQAVRDHLQRLRNHGAVGPFIHTELGYNSRLDEIQAALLRSPTTGHQPRRRTPRRRASMRAGSSRRYARAACWTSPLRTASCKRVARGTLSKTSASARAART